MAAVVDASAAALAGLNLKSCDYLSLASNNTVARMLAKTGLQDTQQFTSPEVVLFSDFVVKINPRDKPQERVLVITNRALYNLLPTNYAKCKRRISLSAVESITVSIVSDEFVLHVPTEYDYRLMSLRKKEVVDTLKSVYAEATAGPLEVAQTDLIVLKSLCITKYQAHKTKRDPKNTSRFSANSMDSEASSSTAGGSMSANETSIKRSDTNSTVTGWGKEHTDVTPEDFELLKVVGRGSFGKVMLVKRKGENATYAMKVLRKQAIIDRNQVEHTKAERQILVETQHPFLMGLHYAFQTKSKLYLVMDYLTGGELFFHLKAQRRFDESRARFYTAEIALGLGHLHSRDIIYRDLKPENILLDCDGHIRLTDFGLSKKYDGTKAQTFCGTPEYLAPEVIMGAGHDKGVDWWSLGILLYEMIVGIPPWYSENVNHMYDLIQRGDLRMPSIVSAESRDLIVGLLVRNPAHRLGNGAGDVADIKATSFFSGLDFDALLRKEIAPSFVPVTKGKGDTSNFDAEFTNEPVVDSFAPSTAMSNQKFENFTYVPNSAMGAGEQ